MLTPLSTILWIRIVLHCISLHCSSLHQMEILHYIASCEKIYPYLLPNKLHPHRIVLQNIQLYVKNILCAFDFQNISLGKWFLKIQYMLDRWTIRIWERKLFYKLSHKNSILFLKRLLSTINLCQLQYSPGGTHLDGTTVLTRWYII